MLESGEKVWTAAGWLLISSSVLDYATVPNVWVHWVATILAATAWLLISLVPSRRRNFFYGNIALTISAITISVLAISSAITTTLVDVYAPLLGTSLDILSLTFLTIGAVVVSTSPHFTGRGHRVPLCAMLVADALWIIYQVAQVSSHGSNSLEVQFTYNVWRIAAVTLPVLFGVMILLNASRRGPRNAAAA